MRQWKDEFQEEIKEISTRHGIKPFRAFIFWYIKATEDLPNDEILSLITDGSNDGGIDALFIDHDAHKIKIFQSKFSLHIGENLIDKDELAKFNKVCEYLENSSSYIQQLREYVNERLRNKIDEAVRYIKEEGYKPELIFITTHNVNGNSHLFDVNRNVRIVGSKQLENKFKQWEVGGVPDLRGVELPYLDILLGPENPRGFIANLSSSDLQKMYRNYKQKLFSRNVRIFYGDSGKKRFRPNPKIRETLTTNADKFWYFNNGITILCDEIKQNSEQKILTLNNPQIINGCQTVTTIGENEKSEASIFAKIIEIGDNIANQELIDGIIEANNRQNPVDERILKSNHPLQVKLQRKLEQFGYYYERKEGEYKEQAKHSPYKLIKIDNRDLVKANVAILSEPHHSMDDENELFSSRFSEVFKQERTYFEYLIPYLLWNEIRYAKPAFSGSKEKQSLYRYSTWHILRSLYDHCSYLRKDQYLKQFATLLKNRKIKLDNQLINDIFEKIFFLYKKSDLYGENSGQRDFFKGAKTYVSIKQKMPKYIPKKIEAMFCGQIEE